MMKKNNLKDIIKNEKFKKLFYYSFHGVITTIISLVTFKIFLLLNIQYIIAFSLSWIMTNTYAYVSTRKTVFDSIAETRKEKFEEGAKFLGGRFLTYIFNTALLFVCVDILHYDPFISNIFISMIVIVLNYFVSKFVIKTDKEQLV